MKQLFIIFLLFAVFSVSAQNKTRYVKSDGLNIRETESVTSRVIVTLKKGDAVELLGYKSKPTIVNGNKGAWVQVSFAKKQGYVFDFHLSETKVENGGIEVFFMLTNTNKPHI